MSEKWHGGKGDKSRISNHSSYSTNYEKAFRKMTWKYWAKYEGLDYDEIFLKKANLDEDAKITYKQFKESLNNE
jgi:hypothetical protein